MKRSTSSFYPFSSNWHATNANMFIIQCPILWYAKVCAPPSAHSSYYYVKETSAPSAETAHLPLEVENNTHTHWLCDVGEKIRAQRAGPPWAPPTRRQKFKPSDASIYIIQSRLLLKMTQSHVLLENLSLFWNDAFSWLHPGPRCTLNMLLSSDFLFHHTEINPLCFEFYFAVLVVFSQPPTMSREGFCWSGKTPPPRGVTVPKKM